MRIESNNSALDTWISPETRALVPVADASNSSLTTLQTADKPSTALSPLAQLAEGVRIRSMSPRQMSDMSMNLYVAGYLQWDEYAMLAFQPELHPDFDKTIGALTGEKAAPDRPKDFISEWEERLAFEQRNGEDQDRLNSTQRILTLFKKIEHPTNVVA
jgi:hypothetical protein